MIDVHDDLNEVKVLDRARMREGLEQFETKFQRTRRGAGT